MNLLIVDDHAGIRELIREVLSDFTTNVLECSSGEEAIAACSRYSPDLVTMDLRMSGMNGLACVQLIRAHHPATHIAVVTHLDHNMLRERAISAGADAYIIKDDLESLRRFAKVLASQSDD